MLGSKGRERTGATYQSTNLCRLDTPPWKIRSAAVARAPPEAQVVAQQHAEHGALRPPLPSCHPNWNDVAGVNATNVAGLPVPPGAGFNTSGCLINRLSRVAKLGLSEPVALSLRMFWEAISALEHT